jgi:hypothetical protein
MRLKALFYCRKRGRSSPALGGPAPRELGEASDRMAETYQGRVAARAMSGGQRTPPTRQRSSARST